MHYKVLQVTMADRLRVEVMTGIEEKTQAAMVKTVADALEGHAPYLQNRTLAELVRKGAASIAEAVKRELLRRQLHPRGNTVEVRLRRSPRLSRRDRG